MILDSFATPFCTTPRRRVARVINDGTRRRRQQQGMIFLMNSDYTDKNASLGALYRGHLETITARHDHALEQAGASHAIIYSGNPKVAFLDDNNYPFKANPHFLSWVPLTALPFSYIVYAPGETPILVYFQPRDYWHVVPGAPDGYWTSHFDVRVVHTVEDIGQHLPEQREKCILIGEIDDDAMAFAIERINPTTAINILHHARGSKTDYELAAMRLASLRGASGHRAAEAAFHAGASEFDIHRAYCKAVSHTDAELPYGNIIALNAHGAVLHYTDLDRETPDTIHSFLIDAGAQVHGYASDITRTYSSGDTRFQELIDRMDAMQRDIVDRVRVGVDYRAVTLRAGQTVLPEGRTWQAAILPHCWQRVSPRHFSPTASGTCWVSRSTMLVVSCRMKLAPQLIRRAVIHSCALLACLKRTWCSPSNRGCT